MSRLQVSYTLRYGDTFRFNLYHLARSPFMRALALAYLGYTSWLLWTPVSEGEVLWAKVIAFLIVQGGLFGFWLLLLLPLLALVLFTRKYRDWYVNHTITITDNSLEEETPNGLLQTRWDTIPKIAKTKNLIIVYRNKRRAHVVPRRVFETSGEFDLFFHEIKTRFKAAKGVSDS